MGRAAPSPVLLLAVLAVSASGLVVPAHPGAEMATRTMRKVVFSRASPEGVRLASAPAPTAGTIGDGQVLCRVACAGINPVDAKGLVGDKLPPWLGGLGRAAVEGAGVGFDFSGIVVRAPAASALREGDAVFGTAPPMTGSFAEEIIVPLDQVAPKPRSLSFAEAAALPLVGLTALQSLVHDNGLCQGQHLLVIGASGGVGHVACQLAKAVGAAVTAVCSARNHDLNICTYVRIHIMYIHTHTHIGVQHPQPRPRASLGRGPRRRLLPGRCGDTARPARRRCRARGV